MQTLLFALTLFVTFQVHAQVEGDKGPAKWWFKVLPEEESLETIGAAKNKELRATSLKALVWNIKKSGMAKWQSEFKKFSENRDLILVQEAYANDFFRTVLATYFGYRWDVGISFLYRKDNNTPTGTMIGSTVAASYVDVMHSPDEEPVLETPKSLTLAKYPVKGKTEELLVISIHGINFQTTAAFKRHIDRAFESISEHTGPILFAGDFNTWNNPRTNYLYRMCKKHDLKAVKFKNGHHRLMFNGYYLDHSFVRGLEVTHAEVIGESEGSDHKPLLLEMNVL